MKNKSSHIFLVFLLLAISSYSGVRDESPAKDVLSHLKKKGIENISDMFFNNEKSKSKLINTYSEHVKEFGQLKSFELITSSNHGAWLGSTYKLIFKNQIRVYNFVYLLKNETYTLLLLNIFENWSLKDDNIFNDVAFNSDHLDIKLKNGMTRSVEKDFVKNVMVVTFHKETKIEIILKDKSLYYSNPEIYLDKLSMQLHVSEINSFLKSELIR